ncbi:unnamed protein product [Didymodactylos carnosus]|uniref:C2H2-type domain-containing protein n=1 Tax=Didymodactylos carnosus TaxID=1234261 RepID=A0A814L8E2_9BILA|nr:unnamed protein product [Didymodactylos carnosus]CAF3830498.1 unnamed protein product [Didymodactylos carnosus]
MSTSVFLYLCFTIFLVNIVQRDCNTGTNVGLRGCKRIRSDSSSNEEAGLNPDIAETCGECGKSFEDLPLLHEHIRSYHPEIQSVIESEKEEDDFAWHNELSGSSESEEEDNDEPAHPLYDPRNENQCRKCGRIYMTKYHLAKHMKQKHRHLWTPCPIDDCYSNFRHADSIHRHMRHRHPAHLDPQTGLYPGGYQRTRDKKQRQMTDFRCSECHSYFPTARTLHDHGYNLHTFIYKCPDVSCIRHTEPFTTKQNCEGHLKTKHPNLQLQCIKEITLFGIIHSPEAFAKMRDSKSQA